MIALSEQFHNVQLHTHMHNSSNVLFHFIYEESRQFDTMGVCNQSNPSTVCTIASRIGKILYVLDTPLCCVINNS